jgi:hypothetical protein
MLTLEGRSSVVEQRPFKPKVVGSIPTAPTNIFFVHSDLWFFEGPQGAINTTQLAERELVERPCSSPPALRYPESSV